MALPQSVSTWILGLSTTLSLPPQVTHFPIKRQILLWSGQSLGRLNTVGPHFTKGLPATCIHGISQDLGTKSL